jgi:peptide/nickel transport system substrate-binding protein
MIGQLGYSYLTKYDAHGEIVADAATMVPTVANRGIARDGRRVTFHLRRDVLWQDAAPLTSRDVVFTYHAIMNPANDVPSRDAYDRISTVRAFGPYTVIVELKRPYAPIVSNFFGGDSNYAILPANLLAAYPSLNHVAYNGAPIGSGPYRFTSWTRGDRLDLTANGSYYAGKPRIRNVSLRFVGNASTIVNELMTNEVAATFSGDPAKIAGLRAIPDHRVIVTPVPYFYAAAFNVTDPLVRDIAVRRAFALAIDRRSIVDKAFHGLYDADAGIRGLFTWAFDSGVGRFAYDPRRAQALLARDGWVSGRDGILIKDGRRLEIQVALNSTSLTAATVLPLIIQQERAIGIDVAAKGYGNQFFALDGPLYQGRFQVALVNYQSTLDPDPSWLVSCRQRAPNGFNWARYCNPVVDDALQRGLSVYDRTTRRRIYRVVQRQLIADVPYAFLWQLSEIDVLPSELKGYGAPLLSPYSSVARWRW